MGKFEIKTNGFVMVDNLSGFALGNIFLSPLVPQI